MANKGSKKSNNQDTKNKNSKKKKKDNKGPEIDSYWKNLLHDKSLWAMIIFVFAFAIIGGLIGRFLVGIL